MKNGITRADIRALDIFTAWHIDEVTDEDEAREYGLRLLERLKECGLDFQIRRTYEYVPSMVGKRCMFQDVEYTVRGSCGPRGVELIARGYVPRAADVEQVEWLENPL